MSEIIVAGSALLVSIISIGGYISTIARNGRAQAARDQKIESNQEMILRRLDDPKHGLAAIDDKVDGIVNNCVKTSTGFDEKIKAAERDIIELKKRNK